MEPISVQHYALAAPTRNRRALIRQAALLAPFTETIFSVGGHWPGQRVDGYTSGVGDFGHAGGQLVGPSGEVVGVERDAHSISPGPGSHGRGWAAECDLTQSDVRKSPPANPLTPRWAVLF